MKPVLIAFAIFLSILFASKSTFSQETEWEKILDDEEGIYVFKRKLSDSDIYEFKGVGLVDAPAPKLIALFVDVDYMTEWSESCVRSVLLERNFSLERADADFRKLRQTYYAESYVPWPFDNRDYIVEARVHYTPAKGGRPEVISINCESAPSQKWPPKEGIVRIDNMHIRCDMTPAGDNENKTMMTFIIHADPGGNIPDWLVNLLAKETPYKTIQKIRRAVLEENWSKEIEKLIWTYFNQRHIYASESRTD